MKYRARVLLGVVTLGVGAWSACPEKPPPPDSVVDLVVVRKAQRRLELYRGDQLIKAYAVSLGRHPLDRKEQQGDGRTPEGEYLLDYRNAHTAFHKALHVSYPAPADAAAAHARGLDAGGQVMIHGMKTVGVG